MNGVQPQYIIAGIAVVILIGFAGYSTLSPAPVEEPVVAVSGPEGSAEEGEETQLPTPSTSSGQATTPKPATTPSTSSGQANPAPSEPTATPTPPSSGSEPVAPSVPPAAPAPYNPGFQAATRIHPGIPSENERATLPSCEGKKFTTEPVNLGSVSSITATGSTHGGAPYDHVLINFGTSGSESKYDLAAPQDVWVTTLIQEGGISIDNSDTTIYFALCRDVFGYVTHIKELSTQTYKILTDSYCFGKPHTGPNACKIEILQLIAGGSPLGKVGRLEGTFGMGVIDLRVERGLANPTLYSVVTNFAKCPFGYFTDPQRFFIKLTTEGICSK